MTNLSREVATYTSGDQHAEKLALFLPGLLDSKDYPHMRSHVDFFASLGFYAIAIDMPGTWGSGNDIRRFSTTSCLAAIDGIISTFGRPTFVMGHSNGGRLAVLAAERSRQVEAVACVMSAATIYSSDQMDAWRVDKIKVSNRDVPDNPSVIRRFELPFAFCEDAGQYNAPESLKTLAIPKLFVSGDQDVIVTSREIQKTYDSSADPKQLLTIHSDHDYRRHPRIICQLNDTMRHFLVGTTLSES